ncbi:hypothetical protein FACS1894184_07790 [Clostridia bacterium]|nr:hypothetical protein FACS1894184_07790 [Clostridia bacterium]
MKRIVALALAALFALTVFSIPAFAAGEEISIVYGGGTPLTSDPALNSASAGANIIRLGHAGLMGFRFVDGESKLAPELAESFTVSDDKLVYTFKLRDGLKWSDGEDFAPSQLAASWQRASSEALGADYGFMFDVIKGYNEGALDVVADDTANTFTITLNAPTPYFLELAAFPTFFPVRTELTDDNGEWAINPETNIGMGAFRMTKYAVDDVISFEKNPNYWDADSVSLEKVNCLLSEDNVAILATGTAPKKLYRIKRHPHAQHMNGGESYEKYSRKGNSTKKVLS